MTDSSQPVIRTTEPNSDSMLERMSCRAFPQKATSPQGDTILGYGLTKRELFAAMAMQGICGDGIPGSHHRPEDTARDAVNCADALLKELAK